MADQANCCNFNCTTLELIGLAFSGFVAFLVVFAYVRYLLLWRLPPAAAGSSHEPPPKAGLDPSAIAALPSFAYRHGGEEAKRASVECAVCLGAVEKGETVRLLPACGHMFHSECVDLWLLSKPSCPVCRADAVPGEKANLEEGRRAAASPAAVEVAIGETSGAKKEQLGVVVDVVSREVVWKNSTARGYNSGLDE